MKIRLTQPKNNKYYIRQVTGGLNGAVAGSPTIAGANVLCNCVGYANGRFNEIINDPNLTGTAIKFKYQLVCNAENFIESAKKQGLSISSTPIEGGIMVWQKGATLGGGDGAGHVAVVEEVYDDGSILTSESGYGAWAFKTIHRNNSNGRWGQSSAYKFRGCIINPSITDPKVVPVPPLVVDGIGGANTIRAMQKYFGTPQDGIVSGQTKSLVSKYCPSIISVEYGTSGSPCIRNLQRWLDVTQDGIIGQNTVKAWQRKLGVSVDGIFGPNSMKAWQRYLNDHDGEKPVYPEKTIIDKELEACPVQADYMKNSKYAWESNPTVAKSKYKGTCVTYVACVLQRIGILPSGSYVWHDEGKVYGNNNKMTVTYTRKKPSELKSTLKAGDIIIDGDPHDNGSGSHIFILTGQWSGSYPIIWDNWSGQDGKGAYVYKRNRSLIAIIRLK
jgi:peptidoglycan hydrolase-like protein with peptidoglycan-binding domain